MSKEKFSDTVKIYMNADSLLEIAQNESRVGCKQCSRRILEDTYKRNDGLCGLCHNWKFPQSKRNIRNVANMRKGVRFAMQASTIAFLLFVGLVIFTFTFIDLSMSFASLVSWSFSGAFSIFFLCLSIALYHWGKRRTNYSDRELFEEMKKNYLKNIEREKRHLSAK